MVLGSFDHSFSYFVLKSFPHPNLRYTAREAHDVVWTSSWSSSRSLLQIPWPLIVSRASRLTTTESVLNSDRRSDWSKIRRAIYLSPGEINILLFKFLYVYEWGGGA